MRPLWDTQKRQGHWLHIQSFTEATLLRNPAWLNKRRGTRQVHIPADQLISIKHVNEFDATIDALFVDLRDSAALKKWLDQLKQHLSFDAEIIKQLVELEPLPPELQQQQQLALYEARLSIDPADVDAWFGKATIYYELNDLDKALVAINKACELKPNNLEITWCKGCILAEYAIAHDGHPKKMLHEAIDLFKSVALIASPSTLYYNVGNSLAGLGEHKEAIEQFDEALAANPPADLAAQIWKNRGTSYFHLGNHQEEFVSYEKALALDPNRWEAYSSWATTELSLGNIERARDLFMAAFAANPRLWSNASQVYSLAFALWKLDAHEEAYERVNQAIALNPNYGDALLLKSYILIALWRQNTKYVPEAIQHYQSLLLDDPENILAKSELHLLYVAQGTQDAARQIIEDAVQGDDVPPMVLFDHAIFLERDGDLPKAITQLEKALEKSQEHHIVHTLARLKKKTGSYREAIYYYRLAMADASDPASILSDIADCYYYLREFRDCALIMLDLIQGEPSSISLWGNLTYALDQLGQTELLSIARGIFYRLNRGYKPDAADIEVIITAIRSKLN